MYVNNDSLALILPSEALDVLHLGAALKASWNEDTAYPGDMSKWTRNNPSIGQCAATSLVAQDLLGGTIHANSDFHHYWNQLPSGAFVDFTHDQFGIDEPIASQGEVERHSILQGEKASRALTKQRYEVLKERVQKELKRLKATVFLISSNARAEYIHDIIETMGIPQGTIQHFRYRLRYIDHVLRKLLPLKGEERPKFLISAKTMVVYLNQRRISSEIYRWNDWLPIRMAIIRDAYKTGETDNSIAHFFLEVRESLVKSDMYNENFREIFGRSFEKAYALLTFEDTTSLVEKRESGEVFETQCEGLKDVGFTYETENGTVEYDSPLLVLFEGLYTKRGFRRTDTVVKPRYDASVPKSFYCLLEGVSYRYRFRTYSWEYTKPYKIRLQVAKQLFSTPEEYSLAVKSAYDSECWEVAPAFVERSTIGHMKLEIKSVQPTSEQLGPTELNWIVLTAFRVRRRWLPRILDVLSDFLFAFGPVYIAGTKIYENVATKPGWVGLWPQVLIGTYCLWLLVKLVRKGISG
jgi:hypothetical protein